MMNKEERAKYLEEHKDEVEKQVQMIGDELEKSFGGVWDELKDIMAEANFARPDHYKQAREKIEKSVDEEYSNDSTIINGIDLNPYLDKIRFDRLYEHQIILGVKANKVIVEKILSSDNAIDTELTEEKLEPIYKEIKENGCEGVIFVHNHPHHFAAFPSKQDIKATEYTINKLKEMGLSLIEDAVVTIDDYGSGIKKSLDNQA